MRLAALLLLCAGCAHWPATPAAGFRRMAAAHLEICVQGNLCQYAPQCFSESAARCTAHGYEPSCGQMEREASCGEAVR